MEGKIYGAIASAMSEIDAIGKTKRNAQQGFLYRGVDDVMNTLNPILVRNKIFIVPEVCEQTREERHTSKGGTLLYSICKIKFRFYTEDGSYIEAVTIGEGMDSGDKATNKAMAIAFKYACFQVFCIPTEEMKDPDEDTPPESTKGYQDKLITDIDVKAIKSKIKKKGLSEASILEYNKVDSFEKLLFSQFNTSMKLLDNYPDKE